MNKETTESKIKRCINPFPIPDKNDNDTVKLEDEIRKHIAIRKLDFHTMLNILEMYVTKKEVKLSKYCCYYCTNVILSNPDFDLDQKLEFIDNLTRTILDLEYEIENAKKNENNEDENAENNVEDFDGDYN